MANEKPPDTSMRNLLRHGNFAGLPSLERAETAGISRRHSIWRLGKSYNSKALIAGRDNDGMAKPSLGTYDRVVTAFAFRWALSFPNVCKSLQRNVKIFSTPVKDSKQSPCSAAMNGRHI